METIEISFNNDLDERYKNNNSPVAVVFCYKAKKGNYCPMIIGMNYDFNDEYHIYRQALYQMVKKAREINSKQVYIGMDASIEKQKLGAIKVPKSTFIQAEDNYNMELISLLKSSE